MNGRSQIQKKNRHTDCSLELKKKRKKKQDFYKGSLDLDKIRHVVCKRPQDHQKKSLSWTLCSHILLKAPKDN